MDLGEQYLPTYYATKASVVWPANDPLIEMMAEASVKERARHIAEYSEGHYNATMAAHEWVREKGL